MIDKSHLTAIGRRDLPVPTRFLIKNGYLVGSILDYGCGKCHLINNKHFNADGFDAHPSFPQSASIRINMGRYNTIICNYVLCVVPLEERLPILRTIQTLLTDNGTAYISVRNDKPKNGWGVSSKGTYQGRVRKLMLPLLYKNSQFRIYTLTKQTVLS